MSKECLETCQIATWCESRVSLASDLAGLTGSEAAQRRARQIREWPQSFLEQVVAESCAPGNDCVAEETIAKRVVQAQMAADTESAR